MTRTNCKINYIVQFNFNAAALKEHELALVTLEQIRVQKKENTTRIRNLEKLGDSGVLCVRSFELDRYVLKLVSSRGLQTHRHAVTV